MEGTQGTAVDRIREAVYNKRKRPDVVALWDSVSDQLDGIDGFAKELLTCYRSCDPGSPQQVSIMRMFVDLHTRAAESTPESSEADTIPEEDIKAAFMALTKSNDVQKS